MTDSSIDDKYVEIRLKGKSLLSRKAFDILPRLFAEADVEKINKTASSRKQGIKNSNPKTLRIKFDSATGDDINQQDNNSQLDEIRYESSLL
jgi:hypothetical protein